MNKISQEGLFYIIVNKMLLFDLLSPNGRGGQRLQIGMGGPHLVPGWIRETETFWPAKRDESLREVDVPSSTQISDPVVLFQGREHPRWMYHPTAPMRLVASPEEEAQLGQEWTRVYIHQDYPKVMYHWSGDSRTVINSQEEAALGNGWAGSPGAFAPYKGNRQPRTEDQDPTKWLRGWSVPGLTSEHQKKIEAILLRADGDFDRSPDPEAGALAAMRKAFDGIARVLFDGAILSAEVLREGLPQLVWDSAIAAAWWRLASESRQNIFPEPIGHYWVWREGNTAALGLFRAETRIWLAELREASVAVPAPGRSGGPEDNGGQAQVHSHVDLLLSVVAEKGITVETWAKDNKIGRSTVFDWKAARLAGLPLRGRVSPEKCAAIEEAIVALHSNPRF
jgi:hypothetical protein